MAKLRKLNLTGSDPDYAKKDFQREKDQSRSEETPRNFSKPQKEKHLAKGETEIPKKIALNMALKLNTELAVALKDIAKKHGVDQSQILKAARLSAHKRLKRMIAKRVMPDTSSSATKHGMTVKYSGVFVGEEAETLTEWFDPLGIGVPNEVIRPTLEKLLHDELRTILDRG